ncbi:MAG: M23 family metallopeptidase, partial [Caldilineaceae bacterium]|nr:M23 family metallopeptidase [Caldilineaceae bacterium]
LLGPYNNFYGNAVVIRLNRKLAVAGGELDVFLLYGHLSQVTVQVGDQVRPEDVVGMVGMTGIAIGPHLHVEIRLGANTYFNNVNPYLWVAPLEGNGAVAVRVLTADGRTWPNARISLVRYAGGTAAWARQIITYMDVECIGPDPAWGENGAMDGVPAGSYYVIGVVNGERLSAEITVEAGRTSFVELRTQQ